MQRKVQMGPMYASGRRAMVRCRAGSTPRPARDVALLDFIQYAIRSKIEFAAVRPDSVGGLRGLYATAPISPRDTLVAVPRRSGLVVIPHEPSPFPSHLPEAAWAGLPWYGQLATKLAAEVAAGPSSSMREFIRALPRQAVDLPAMWSEDDIMELDYPHLEAEVWPFGDVGWPLSKEQFS